MQYQEIARSCKGDGKLSQPTFTADRKSTRLNSSHLVISYAVFCLKKKNSIHDSQPPHTIPRNQCVVIQASPKYLVRRPRFLAKTLTADAITRRPTTTAYARMGRAV